MTSLISLDYSNSTSNESINILSEINELESEIRTNRRWFHANPEISLMEYETSKKIAEYLRSYGIEEIHENVGGTGIIALIRGTQNSPCIALRADMDALPITETADIEYISMNKGVMHACGHDGHITGLLAAAKILNSQKDKLLGTVKLIFQPAEEGGAGAREMINDGCLDADKFGPKIDRIYGIHLWSCKFVWTLFSALIFIIS